jgi:hypothetical protein
MITDNQVVSVRVGILAGSLYHPNPLTVGLVLLLMFRNLGSFPERRKGQGNAGSCNIRATYTALWVQLTYT